MHIILTETLIDKLHDKDISIVLYVVVGGICGNGMCVLMGPIKGCNQGVHMSGYSKGCI